MDIFKELMSHQGMDIHLFTEIEGDSNNINKDII